MILQFSPTLVPSQKIECGLAHVIRRSVAEEKRLLAPATGQDVTTPPAVNRGRAQLGFPAHFPWLLRSYERALGTLERQESGRLAPQLHVGPAIWAALRGAHDAWRTNREQESMTRGVVQF